MTVKGKDVIGLNIVTIDTGTIVETVDDIAFNPSTHRVEALLVSSGGIFSSAKAIHIDDVKNIGEDAVIVQSADVIKSVKELDDTVHSIADSNKHLVKTNVMTSDGKDLGRVTDIFFDSVNGYVSSMEVSQGGLKTLSEGKKSIKPSDIVTIGADTTIVTTYTELELEAQGEQGGLKGRINEAKEKAAEIAENTKDVAQATATKVKDTSEDVANNVRQKSAELRDDTEVRAEKLRNTLDQKSTEAKIRANELRDDVEIKSKELGDTVSRKAQELSDTADAKSAESRLKAQELADDAKVKASELQASAKEKSAQTKDKIDDLAAQAKVEADKRRTTVADKKVVKKTKKQYEDAAQQIKIEETKITEK